MMRSLKNLSASLIDAIGAVSTLDVHGRVKRVVGTLITASVPSACIGEICRLYTPGEAFEMQAEVVGFHGADVLLSPIGTLQGIATTTLVVRTGKTMQVAVGPALLGRVLDGFGAPLDDPDDPIIAAAYYPVFAEAPPPLSRQLIVRPLPLGIRAIDGLLTCAEGQRIGIFAAAGGGKSTLLGMLAKSAEVDVTVIALIGERGREVREFLDHELGAEHRARCVVVCATSDRSPMERTKAALVATAMAEYFRDQGQRVLFLMDSVTRFARAQREIGLAAGEPPTRRGFPPSVFGMLPRLMERTGMNDRGSITAFYTVLVEGDDMNEPIADETRSILDGHIILSRKLGAKNHYPAIDVLASVSRVMNAVVQNPHRQAAGRLREMLAKYDEVELLIKLGEYKRGADPMTDKAIDRMDKIRAYLCQKQDERSDFADTLKQLQQLTA